MVSLRQTINLLYLHISNVASRLRHLYRSPMLWSGNILGGLSLPDPSPLSPSSILQLSNCPSLQLSHSLRHNNSKDAPGASCHPELSFVPPLLSLPDWMFLLFVNAEPLTPLSLHHLTLSSSSSLIILPKLNEIDSDGWTRASSSPLLRNSERHLPQVGEMHL